MTSLTDAQNRYLALAWLCVDVEPKVITSIPNPSMEHEILVDSMAATAEMQRITLLRSQVLVV